MADLCFLANILFDQARIFSFSIDVTFMKIEFTLIIVLNTSVRPSLLNSSINVTEILKILKKSLSAKS